MADIDIEQLKLIVEKNMRNLGFEGAQFESGWKKTLPGPGGMVVDQTFNLQTLRDVVAKSIFDAMTNTTATGSYSINNFQGTQNVNHISDEVKLQNGDVSLELTSAGKVKLGSQAAELLTIIDSLITNLISLSTTNAVIGSPCLLDASTIAKLTIVKTQLALIKS